MLKKKKYKKYFRNVILFFIFLILLYNFVGIIIHSKKEVIVPNLINKSLTESLDIVSKLGLGLKKTGEVYNPNFPAGTVISQQPSAGMRVRQGRFINVVISLGGEKVFVPNIIGEERRKAEILLRQYSLSVGTVTERYSYRYAKNRVMEQEPAAETIVDKYTPVNIVISLGFPPEDVILMPEFINKDVSEVYSWAERYGIEVKVKEQVVEGISGGKVVQQFPQADTVVQPGQEIEVVVSKATKENSGIVEETQYNFEYELPFLGSSVKKVKIVQISPEGEIILYNKPTLPKEKIRLYVAPKPNSKIRIFVDGVLVDEK
ncbi:MAG: PASTA domain-containing protein [Endomicrobia bacterium]|nr:PASTA domain-containing protein [Endomicrobiia bacterium]MCX7941327.1 PASTA domain-containing protein [Endomicrobiia bacterium]MDW8055973.1 PASTA domain-containing protein [Elusimicrobiota bacterium]